MGFIFSYCRFNARIVYIYVMEQKEVEIKEEEHGIFYLFRIKGAFNAKSVLQIRARFEYMLGMGHIKLGLELSEVNFIDSTGIGLIVNMFKNVQKINGHLIIINPSQIVQKVFTLSSLSKCLEIRNSIVDIDSLFN